LSGLPPLIVQVGSEETLLSDATRFAEAAVAARVSLALEVWLLMIHAWPLWNARLAPGRQVLAHLGDFVRRLVQ
jgi:monoterpene epsilon-lactone hydrolase